MLLILILGCCMLVVSVVGVFFAFRVFGLAANKVIEEELKKKK